MEKLREIQSQLCQENVQQIDDFVAGVEEIRSRSFDEILSNVYCPSQIPHITSRQQFEEMIKAHHQSLDSNKRNMTTFLELQDTLKEGDQLWIYHKRTLMKS